MLEKRISLRLSDTEYKAIIRVAKKLKKKPSFIYRLAIKKGLQGLK